MRRERTRSAAETEALGARIAGRLGPGDVVAIRGELGAGKTTLVRGALRELGVEGPVVSPTFTIGRRYRGRVPAAHLDLYRLEDAGAEDPGLLDDYLDGEAICFVEWPDAAADALGEPAARVAIAHAGGDEREITIEGRAG